MPQDARGGAVQSSLLGARRSCCRGHRHFGARMEDCDLGHATSPIKARYFFTLLVGIRVATTRHDDRHRALLWDHPHGFFREATLRATRQDLVEVAIKEGQHNLRLRVPEAAVELYDLGSISCEHQAREEATHKRPSLRTETVDRGAENLALDALELLRRHSGRRGECAHAACVGAAIPIKGPLVILRRRQCDHSRAVGECQDAALGTLQPTFQHELLTRRSELSTLQAIPHRLCGLCPVRRHHHAFAGSKTARLDDHIEVRLLDEAERILELRGTAERLVLRCGDVMALHEFLGEGLGRLDLGSGLGRAEDFDAVGPQLVSDAVGEQLLRAHHNEADRLLLAKSDDLPEVRRFHAELHRLHGGGIELACRWPDASVTRSHVDATDLRRLAQLPCQCVLPTTRAEDEHWALGAREGRGDAVASAGAAFHPEHESTATDLCAALCRVVAGEVPIPGVVRHGLVEILDGLVQDFHLRLAISGRHVL
mmetsp:Transcript_133517/g.285495  ORF Transcript_133517/g.285495 Transcript_133517/m.285495 type:complete len:484 (-) Transcript_133517:1010-2461(-)